MLIDSHCHLNFNAFDEDRGDVLARAAEAEIVAIINPATTLEDSQQIVAMAEGYSHVFGPSTTWGKDSGSSISGPSS